MRASRRLETFAGTRRAAAAVFVLALADFAVQEAAWPVTVGKNLNEYLLGYIQLLDRHPLLPWAPLYRGPGTGAILGPLLALDGGLLVEAGAAVMFAISVLAWARVASFFGPRVAIVTAFALLLYPGYGELFHYFASEIVMAAAFALWALAVARAAARPSTGRFVLAGLALAALVLIRPGNAVLVPFTLFPLVLRGDRRRRLAWVGGFAAAACLPLLAWTLQNGWRYGDYTLARGGSAVIPFYRTFVVDKIASPKNGPASRRLAAAIQAELLDRNPYKGYHVTLKQVFSTGSRRVHEDLYALSDETWGWSSAYSTLRDAGIEAIQAHPGSYASGVVSTLWDELSSPTYSSRVPAQRIEQSTTHVILNAHGLPKQDPGELIPPGETATVSRPDHGIRQVWTSPTTFTFVVRDPGQRPRFHQILRELAALETNFPHRDGVDWLQVHLNSVSHRYPRPFLWLLLGLVALPFRRPRGSRTLIALALSAFVVVLLDALGQAPEARYMLPVVPAFVLFGAASLLGQRSTAARAS